MGALALKFGETSIYYEVYNDIYIYIAFVFYFFTIIIHGVFLIKLLMQIPSYLQHFFINSNYILII